MDVDVSNPLLSVAYKGYRCATIINENNWIKVLTFSTSHIQWSCNLNKATIYKLTEIKMNYQKIASKIIAIKTARPVSEPDRPRTWL